MTRSFARVSSVKIAFTFTDVLSHASFYLVQRTEDAASGCEWYLQIHLIISLGQPKVGEFPAKHSIKRQNCHVTCNS